MQKTTYSYSGRRRSLRPLLVSICIVLVAAAGAGGVLYMRRSSQVLPPALHKQISFVVYVPAAPWETAAGTYRYDAKNGVLSFASRQGDRSLSFSEQAAPSQFTDIPQYYPALLNKLNQYDSVGTANGTVNLIRPTELNGKQEAVIYQNGTLIFVNPGTDLPKDDWRKLFNAMRIVK